MNGAIPPVSPTILHGVDRDILVFTFSFFFFYDWIKSSVLRR